MAGYGRYGDLLMQRFNAAAIGRLTYDDDDEEGRGASRLPAPRRCPSNGQWPLV